MTSPAPFVRPDVRRFLDYLNAQPRQDAATIGAPAMRQMMRALYAMADLETGEIAVIRNFAMPGPDGDVALRLFDTREARAPGPALLFLHGGGFAIGDLDSYQPLCAAIARGLDLPVIAVDYRLSPEHAFPAAQDDCEAAARWLADNGTAIGRAITGLVLAGDSAGGLLTIVTALALRDRPAALPVLACWAAYPATDSVTHYPSYKQFSQGYLLTDEGMRWFTDCHRADPSDWRANPLLADPAGLPAMLVTTAGLDPIRDQGRAFVAKLAGAGVPHVFREARGTVHGFLNLRKALPSAQGDLAGAFAALRPLIAEAEAERVMAAAA